MNGTLTIGQVARAVGCNVRTIRYYEQVGLLPAPVRTGGNQRRFLAADLRRLSFILRSRELGFPLTAIRSLLELADQPEQSCAAITGLARERLAEIDLRLARLSTLRRELAEVVERCPGGPVSSCRIIEALAADRPAAGPR